MENDNKVEDYYLIQKVREYMTECRIVQVEEILKNEKN